MSKHLKNSRSTDSASHDIDNNTAKEIRVWPLDLCDWLDNEAEELMAQSIGRREMAKTSRDCTEKELRVAKRLAEKMMGRKLPSVTTDPEESREQAEMQDRIADKLEAKSRKLTQWAGSLRRSSTFRQSPSLSESDA